MKIRIKESANQGIKLARKELSKGTPSAEGILAAYNAAKGDRMALEYILNHLEIEMGSLAMLFGLQKEADNAIRTQRLEHSGRGSFVKYVDYSDSPAEDLDISNNDLDELYISHMPPRLHTINISGNQFDTKKVAERLQKIYPYITVIEQDLPY